MCKDMHLLLNDPVTQRIQVEIVNNGLQKHRHDKIWVVVTYSQDQW